MQQIYTIQQMRECLAPVFRKNNVRKATIFGSYSKGVATLMSDIDLMVDSGLHGLAFFGLLEDINEMLECEVDLIDVSQIIPDSKIDQEIRRTGVVIYEE